MLSEKRQSPEGENKDYLLPAVAPEVFRTEKGIAYLQSPGVAVISIPHVDLRGVQNFLNGFPPELNFIDYLKDPVLLPPAETLCKFAGQLCYESFGPKRTYNENANKYFLNILESGHGSVLEHANISMFFWGISRSLTHELVRHRAGFGFSQVSQRFVGGKTLRFVERPAYQHDEFLHKRFQNRIEYDFQEYEEITDYLLAKQLAGDALLSSENKTDLRKKVRQEARSVLMNETEAPVVVTANIRAWRHFLNMRGSGHAEIEIRRLAFEVYRCLYQIAPIIFEDFQTIHLPDGTHHLHTSYPKV